MELGTRGKGPADVPGVGGASDRAVDEMEGVGYGVEDHPGTAEHAGPLAYRTGQTLPVAGEGKGLLALSVDLVRPFLEYDGFHGSRLHPLHDEFDGMVRGVPVLAILEDAEDLFHETHAAPVTHARKIPVTNTVEDGKAETDERNILGPGDEFPVSIPHEKIHRLLLDPLVKLEEIGKGLDLRVRNRLGENALHGGLESPARGTGDHVDRLHTKIPEKLGHADHMIRISEDGRTLSIEILLVVSHHVHEPASVVHHGLGWLCPRYPHNGLDKPVSRPNTYGKIEDLVGDLEAGAEDLARLLGGVWSE